MRNRTAFLPSSFLLWLNLLSAPGSMLSAARYRLGNFSALTITSSTELSGRPRPHSRSAVAFTLDWTRSLLLLLALLSACATGTVLAQERTLGDSMHSLLEYARSASPELAAMRLEADAASQRVRSAGALPDPVLRIEMMNINNYGNDASLSLLPSRVGETTYTLMQPLPFWGKRDLRREVAAAGATQAVAATDTAWAELAARIKTTYAEYYRAAVDARLTREVLKLFSRLEEIAQARYAGGLVPLQDAIRAQVEQTTMRSAIIALISEQDQLRARMNGLLGRSRTAPLAEPRLMRPLPPLSSESIPTLFERMRVNSPQLQVELARLMGAQKERDLTLRERYPDAVVGVAPTQVGSRTTSWGVMFEVNIPLQQSSRRSQERAAEAMVDAARSRIDALTQRLLGELTGNIAAFDAARQTETLVRTQLLPQSGLTLDSALAAYETGTVDFATLVDAQRQILKAKQELLRAEAEAQIRLAEIERILGEDL